MSQNNTEEVPAYDQGKTTSQLYDEMILSLQNVQLGVQQVDRSAFWFKVYAGFLTVLFFILTLSLVVLDILISMLISNSLIW